MAGRLDDHSHARLCRPRQEAIQPARKFIGVGPRCLKHDLRDAAMARPLNQGQVGLQADGQTLRKNQAGVGGHALKGWAALREFPIPKIG